VPNFTFVYLFHLPETNWCQLPELSWSLQNWTKEHKKMESKKNMWNDIDKFWNLTILVYIMLQVIVDEFFTSHLHCNHHKTPYLPMI
jgi:hypothetical protein